MTKIITLGFLFLLGIDFHQNWNPTDQKKDDERFSPTYSSCEVEHCYGSRILSFSDTTKLLAKMCSHSVGCTAFKNAGKWKKVKHGIIIETQPKFKALSDLNGLFYKLEKENFEILIHATLVQDSTEILSEIENGFKKTGQYAFLAEYATSDKILNKKTKAKLMSEYIKQEITWKYKVLVRDIDP